MQAFHGGSFKTVTKANVLGKWSVFFFYLTDFLPLCVPLSWRTLPIDTRHSRPRAVRVYAVSCDTRYVHKAWHDAPECIRKMQYPILATRLMTWPKILKCMPRRTAWPGAAALL